MFIVHRINLLIDDDVKDDRDPKLDFDYKLNL